MRTRRPWEAERFARDQKAGTWPQAVGSGPGSQLPPSASSPRPVIQSFYDGDTQNTELTVLMIFQNDPINSQPLGIKGLSWSNLWGWKMFWGQETVPMLSRRRRGGTEGYGKVPAAAAVAVKPPAKQRSGGVAQPPRGLLLLWALRSCSTNSSPYPQPLAGWRCPENEANEHEGLGGHETQARSLGEGRPEGTLQSRSRRWQGQGAEGSQGPASCLLPFTVAPACSPRTAAWPSASQRPHPRRHWSLREITPYLATAATEG